MLHAQGSIVLLIWTAASIIFISTRPVEGSNGHISIWSHWIDRSRPSPVQPSDEIESLDPGELHQFCPNGRITNVKCIPVDTARLGTRQDLTCDIRVGLRCLAKYNQPGGCLDYKIKYACERNRNRRRRNVPPATNCNSWHPWINNNHPNTTNKNDKERISQQEISAFCPVNNGASVSKLECKDNKGEAFRGPIIDRSNRYGGNCTDISDGVTCVMFDQKSTDQCPDFSIRFYCNCTGMSQTQGLTTTKPILSSKANKLITPVPTRPVTTIKHVVTSKTSKVTSPAHTITRLTPSNTARKVLSTSITPASSAFTTTTSASKQGPTLSTRISTSTKLTNALTSTTAVSSNIPSTAVGGLTTASGNMTAQSVNIRDSCETKSDISPLMSAKLYTGLLCGCIVLGVLNFILLIVFYKRTMKYVREKWQSKVRPLDNKRQRQVEW